MNFSRFGSLVQRVAIFVVLVPLVGCVTLATPRQPSSRDYPVSFGNADTGFKKVAQALLDRGFTIEHTDSSIGILKASTPFNVVRGMLNIPHPSKATLTVVLKDKLLRVSTSYQCNMMGTECFAEDKEANKAIADFEQKIEMNVSEAIKFANEIPNGKKVRK